MASAAVLLRLSPTLKAEVRKLARVNRRTFTEEARIALEKHVGQPQKIEATR